MNMDYISMNYKGHQYYVDRHGLACLALPRQRYMKMDAALAEAPERDQIDAAKEFILKNCVFTKTFRTAHGSYGWKHIAERWAGRYIGNGAFIQAALELGVEVKPDGSNINAHLKLTIPKKTLKQIYY